MRDLTVGAATPPPGAVLRLLDRSSSRAKSPRGRPPERSRADALVQSFNSWAFKREQPDGSQKKEVDLADRLELVFGEVHGVERDIDPVDLD